MRKSYAPLGRLTNVNANRIIVERSPHGHWDAWFDGRPQEAWGGPTPGTAVDRLRQAVLNDPRTARNKFAGPEDG
jgi:hypothetical protein